jgi:hypothetical protein
MIVDAARGAVFDPHDRRYAPANAQPVRRLQWLALACASQHALADGATRPATDPCECPRSGASSELAAQVQEVTDSSMVHCVYAHAELGVGGP